MKCPHCLVEIHARSLYEGLGGDPTGSWGIIKIQCPNDSCQKWIFKLKHKLADLDPSTGNRVLTDEIEEIMVHPKTSNRPPVPTDVQDEFSEDYKEACLVLTDSPKASAALSRRCLQHLLREKVKVKPGKLHDEIQQVIDSGNLPSHLAESIDAIRNIGNFAAHPTKSESTGEIVPVEEGEAEWNLDVLESLFDFYFVQPAILKRKKDALNKKLKEAGKKPMK